MGDRFDLGLIEAARAGEPSALERLLVQCQPELRRYAQRSCLISDVDDAVQEALIIASRYLSGLRHTRAWSRWMFRIVRRECHRMARVTLRRDLWSDGEVDALVAARSQDELRLDLAGAFESLPQQYREVLVLRDFEGLTIGEMAARLATTTAAIKGRLHRARELVREYLLASGDREVPAPEIDHDHRVAPPAEVLAGSRESSVGKLRRWRPPARSGGGRGNG